MGARATLWSVFLFLAGPLFLPANARAATAEELLEAINRLPAAERQARLEREARKEGGLVWYIAMNRPNALDLARAFEAKYPFLTVKVLNGRGVDLVNRAVVESQAKKYLFDVLVTRSLSLNHLKRAGVTLRYRTPLRTALREGFYDNEGYLNGLFGTPQVFVYNTNLVRPSEAPKSIDDLFHPKWKGKLGMDQYAYDWLAAVLDYYGEEKGKEIARRLGDQELQIRRGPNLLIQLVAAGEFPVVVDGYHHEAIQTKAAGAPIDHVFPEPFIPIITPTNAYASSNPSHPHAMALFIDFLLSKEGQAVMKGHGRWVAHKEMTSPEAGKRKTLVPSPVKWGDRQKELARLFDLLLRKEGPGS